MPEYPCCFCGSSIPINEFFRGDSCAKCKRDTRVCKNCDWYDPAYNNSCRENQADRVVDKEKSNFCDYFKPSFRSFSPRSSGDQAKAAAEALFKKK